ncbi:hypothetical protein [Actinokineospora xionganensis]|uniref:Uncharacterized protein n=1 Tax=Actinokineospora xionganensis TaxID=2684470 RepID=A0ABR7LCJ2_9PSEU|nr:hypothetical protein [Actinokineospora xionganensis]MBC6450431.1 hypothetical protein [Actinokineospora xionganensis]
MNDEPVISRAWDTPYYVVRTDALEARFLPGAGEDPDHVDNADVEVRLSKDGSWYSATILTLAEVDRVMKRWEDTGEALGGRYFHVSDGLIVREPGIENMFQVLAGMHRSGDLTSALQRLDEPD